MRIGKIRKSVWITVLVVLVLTLCLPVLAEEIGTSDSTAAETVT